MFVVVAYDIVDNGRRTRVAGLLEGYGVRVQKSVFELDVNGEQLLSVQRRVMREIAPVEDGVRYYTLCQADRVKIAIQGIGEVHRNPPFYYV